MTDDPELLVDERDLSVAEPVEAPVLDVARRLEAILLIVDVSRRLVWGDRRMPPAAGIAALALAGIAGGFVLGTAAASLLLGHPLRANLTGDGLPLLAAARYLAAHAPTARSQRQTYEIARRLHRGERIYEDDDLPPAA